MSQQEGRARAGAKQGEEMSLGRWLIETVLLVGLAFVLAFGIRTWIVEPFMIPTGSMIPTIEIGNRVLAEKITYRFVRPPRYGDIVVFPDPSGQHPHLIKRVIAVGGQTLDLKEGAVYVDGNRLVEPYVYGKPTTPLVPTVKFPFKVPAGDIFVMGDNRTDSGDSRLFGPIAVKSIDGHAIWTYWPLRYFGKLE